MSIFIKSSWISSAANAISNKRGPGLADAVEESQTDAIFESRALQVFTSKANSSELDSHIASIISEARNNLLKQIHANTAGPEHSSDINARYVEMLTRLVASNAMYKILLQQHQGQKAENQELLDIAHSKRFQALLYSFEAFQEVHTLPRNYANKGGNTTAATPGWDTLPLMKFVHIIQTAAQVTNIDEQTLNQLVRSWRKLLIFLQTADETVPSKVSRRRGALAVANGLLIMLFQHNNTHQCRALLTSIEQGEKNAELSEKNQNKSVLRPASHMIAEVVKFRYYQGRMKLYEKRFAEAMESLQIAYRLTPALKDCNVEQHENKLRIHFYLLVTAVSSGLQPPASVMQADPLCQSIFEPIIEAIRCGNPNRFTEALEAHQQILRRRGVYMFLHQARILCYLYLLQSVHSTVGTAGGDTTKIAVGLVVDGLHLVTGRTVDGSVRSEDREQELDTMCLWLTRLIARGFVRGYLSYEHKVLVLAKNAPFPTLTN